MKKILIALLATMIYCTSCTSSKILQKRQWLKEYAYCKCVQYGRQDSVWIKNDISLPVYRDIAGYNYLFFDMIDSLAKKFADSIEPSPIDDFGGKKAVSLFCFDFYRSRQLDSIARRSDKEIFISNY